MSTEDLILQLITAEPGYAIELFGTLYLRPLEDLSFAVGYDHHEDKTKDWEKTFKDPREALDFSKRRESRSSWAGNSSGCRGHTHFVRGAAMRFEGTEHS